MAHRTQKNQEITINTDNTPEDYAATLLFIVKGDHMVDIHVTDDHLDKLVERIQEFKQQRATI
ncbi:MAG TPA: hypothetical protein ENG03_05840 [Thioploca sp.]|nr:MAG: hypothetical protein B6247_01900 [Beggiatoa sp. 4572_84]RKZ63176.1 MAG: hypothetical protein DRR08_04185 [Gammaproteobacteria bacterium]HDN26606.1 hypothetical protein [Thioploca sp.]